MGSVRYRTRMTWLAAGLAAAGCVRMEVDTQFDPQASFDGMTTWAWMPDRPPDAATGRAFLERMITGAIRSELEGNGYTEAAYEQADLWVNYQLATGQGLDVRTSYDPYGRNVGIGPDVWVDTEETFYVDGTLIIDILEPDSRRLLWRGVASEAIRADPEDAQGAIDKAARALLERFPPK